LPSRARWITLARVERPPEEHTDPSADVRPDATPESSPAPAVPLGFDAGAILAIQRSAGNAALSRLLPGAPPPSTSAHREAPSAGTMSPARLLRSRLRARALQRSVTTSGGEWDTELYDATKDIDSSGNKAPAADGWRGVDITLKFQPGADVDAELIGLSQTAQSYAGGSPLILPAAASRAIPAADAKPLNTGPGETDESAHIDQASTNPNPLYAVENPTSASLTDPATAFFGKHGFHFKDKTGTVQKDDAKLKDTPRMPHGDKNSRQIFETTALATKGVQAGTYYGSVRWGWRTDAAGAYTKLPLEKVAEGVPSSTFLKSAEIWNTGKASGGAANVKLPVPEIKRTSGPVTLNQPVPLAPLALPVGTRVQVETTMAMPALSVVVRVVDGPHNGASGDVDAAEWGNLVDERS
jgi:hypothetical protein